MRIPALLRRAGARGVGAARRAVARYALPSDPFFVSMQLDAPLGDLPAPTRSQKTPGSLLEALLTLDAAARDPAVAGVLLRLDASPAGLSGILSLRRALDALRRRGRSVVVYADSLDTGSLLLASAASRVYMPETGTLHLLGLRAEGLYLRALLARLGVRADVVHVGSHKTAGEAFTRDDMSPEQREQQEALLDDLYRVVVDGLAQGRGLAPADVRDRIDRGLFAAPAAVEAGLLDGCLYADELDAELARLAPPCALGPRGVVRVDARTYAALRPRPPRNPLLREDAGLAYVVAEGAIHRGGGPRGASATQLSAVLEALREAPEVRGVALRIESPGGDALASDLIWRAVERFAREKPVVASLGDVAASGGYYVAAAADAIYAEATTLTGSIGVVGGKLDVSELYRRVGIGRDAVERGARAGMLSETRAFSPDERSALRAGMSSLYASFVDRVARGRNLATEAVLRVAEGRVWSGVSAQQHGLVDALGGPLEALRDLRRRAGIVAGESAWLRVYPRTSPLAGLRGLLRWLRG